MDGDQRIPTRLHGPRYQPDAGHDPRRQNSHVNDAGPAGRPARQHAPRVRASPAGCAAVAALAAAAAGAAYVLAVRPRLLRWGATTQEAAGPLPGDEIVPAPRMQSTRAVTIKAPVSGVWPWLVQLGAGRGGMYSYDWLENAAGLGIHSADRILPELQHLKVGDIVPLSPDGGLEVRSLESGSVLGLGGMIDLRTGGCRRRGRLQQVPGWRSAGRL